MHHGIDDVYVHLRSNDQMSFIDHATIDHTRIQVYLVYETIPELKDGPHEHAYNPQPMHC